jgi:hypothetical protein
MEWAPFEFSKEKRTFSSQQVFDFGKTLAQNNVNQHFGNKVEHSTRKPEIEKSRSVPEN